MAKRYYIAYGSNLNVRQMLMRCPSARIIGTSEIADYRLLFKGSLTGSYLTIEPKAGSTVPVAVWDVNAEDEAALDRYEGYPTFYYKKEMELPVKEIRTGKGIRTGKETRTGKEIMMGNVRTRTGKEIRTGKVRTMKCFVYIMHEERRLGIPTKGYIRTCLEGYDRFGFDWHLLDDAIAYSYDNGGLENYLYSGRA